MYAVKIRSGLFCDDGLLSLRFRLALASTSMFPASFLLDPPCFQHCPLELRSLVYWLRQVASSTCKEKYERVHSVKHRGDDRGIQDGRETYRAILLISASAFQRDLRVSRYSMAARSRAVMIPSLSDACAFQTRTFPSSEPERTNRASPVYNVDITLQRREEIA